MNERINPKQRDPELEYCVTHPGTQPQAGTHITDVIPPVGHGWRPMMFTASHHSTHILWSRPKEQ